MHRPISPRPLSALIAVLSALPLAGCSDQTPGTSRAPDAVEAPPAGGVPGDAPVQLRGTLAFTSEEQAADGTDRSGHSYTRRFAAHCEFTQDAIAWKDPQTGREEFRLAESEPGVLRSNASGSAEAVGDAQTRDLAHEPALRETSTVRLRGPVSRCLIRRLDPAQFGAGHDLELEFQVALSGTTKTSTQLGDAIAEKTSAGLALPVVLAPEPTEPGAVYSLVDDPANTGMHLHASPLLLRPALGSRPAGDGEEVRLRQQVYDNLVTHPRNAWIGLKFDANTRTWTFAGSHVTDAGATHSLDVKIEVSR